MGRLREEIFEVFSGPSAIADDSGRLLASDALTLSIAIDKVWQQCRLCGHVQLKPFLGACVICGRPELDARPPDHPYMTARKGYFREPLLAVLNGERPVHITAEEHTAQLSQRDAGVVYATTEEFELRFQDVPLGRDKPSVDVLSCTTTMEVGLDIGSLTAVGLRTVPPLRENYQQRAGRAGRRGTSVSSVVTFAQGGAHDAYYFNNPASMISGPAREPRIKSDNKRLARRHIYSYLLQTFFHGQMDKLTPQEEKTLATQRPDLMSAFGNASDFFAEEGDFSFDAFTAWMNKFTLTVDSDVLQRIASWLPDEVAETSQQAYGEKLDFARQVAEDLVDELKTIGLGEQPESADGEASSATLLDLLFDRGLLPSYAFPTDLCSFVIQEYGDHGSVVDKERPQLAKAQALSEYAPGRSLVVNKQTYRVGGIVFDGPPTSSPAVGSFDGVRNRYIGCPACSFLRLDQTNNIGEPIDESECPVCGHALQVNELLDPVGFSPEGGRSLREGDREQDITYASSAQLPELIDRDVAWQKAKGSHMSYSYAESVKLGCHK